MSYKHYLFMATLLVLSCQGPQGPRGNPGNDTEIESQLRFSVESFWVLGHAYTDWIINDRRKLHKFNISDYTGIDSAFFVVAMKAAGANSEFSAILYNLTDSADISGSQVSSQDSSLRYIESKNILASIPKKEIELCLKVKNEYFPLDSGSAEISFYMLILYR